MSRDADPSDSDLARRATAGEAEALAALYARHRERLVQLIRRRLDPALRSKLESGDILQSAFLHAVRHYSMAGRGDSEFLPWIARVVENTIIDKARHFTRNKRSRALEEGGPLTESQGGVSPVPTPSAITSRAEDAVLVRSALERLSPSDQQLIRLSRIDGKTAREIAIILDKNLESVKKSIARAMGRLTRVVAGDA